MDAISEIIEIDMQQLCRTCGNTELTLIPIDEDLLQKVNKYLPIHIQKDDILPTQLCANCETAISLWHNFIVECSLQNQRFLEMIEESVEQEQADIINDNDYIPPNEDDEDVPENEDDADLAEENDVEYLEAEDEDLGHETGEMILGDVDDDDEIEKEDADRKIVEGVPVIVPGTQFTSSTATPKDTSEDLEYSNIEAIFNSLGTNESSSHIPENHLGDSFVESIYQNKKKKPKPIKPNVIITDDGKKVYECSECKARLSYFQTFVVHMRTHTGERPFVCKACGKSFAGHQGLARHLRETHEKIKLAACDICGKQFANRRNLAEHRNLHFDKRPYQCSVCGKRFKQNAGLFMHKRCHETERPSFACSDCDQSFQCKASLKVHQSIHTGLKPYKCDICCSQFRLRTEFKLHQLVHSDEKPFECSKCTQSFKQKRYLMRHLKNNHNA